MEVKTAETKTARHVQREVPQVSTSGLHPIEKTEVADEQTMKLNSRIILIVYVVVILLGVGTGYMLSGKKEVINSTVAQGSMIKTDKVAGSTDTTTFKDSAIGTIEKGGLNSEGSHKLIREGGPSQTAYLISSVVDLDEYAGKKVKVWGQTMAAKKVSWLMDVGKIELISE